MTTEEFSNTFDTLLSSYTHNSVFGSQTSIADIVLDEYEKSVLLTEAQEQLILSLYSGKNEYGDSFEQTEELRRYLDNLVKTSTITETTEGTGVSNKSVFYKLPKDLWFITYESVKLNSDNACLNNKSLVVQPVTQDDYDKISRNPFRKDNTRRVLRLDSGNGIVELISDYKIIEYLVRYLAVPTPIILVDLDTEGLSINGLTKKTECILHASLHRVILEQAVKLALASKGIAFNKTTNK